ncbi:MAG: hypothetical protein FVQ81_00705 [Candidatus Glassbacteria bacterium]|nr:hypothetical protein [Candidatus Glassbacteria bacterium]
MRFLSISSTSAISSIATMLIVFTSNPAAAGEVRVVQLPGSGIVPDAVVDNSGTVHVAYVDSTDLYYVKSTDGGSSFSAPVRVNSEPGTVLGGRYRGPDLDLGADGRLHVIWYNLGYQQGLPPEEWGVTYAQIDKSTGEVSGERNLNRRPSDNYSLAAHSTGAVAVIWTAGGMYLQSSDDNGDTFSEPVRVLPESVDPCECCATRTLFTSAGGLYVGYREKADNVRDMYLLSWPDALSGGKPDFRRKLLAVETWKIDLCPMTGSYLIPAPGGGVLAAWETRSKNRFASLDGPGREFKLQPSLVTEKGNYPVVLANDRGQLLVAWKWRNVLHWKLYDSPDDSDPESGSSEARTGDRPGGAVLADGDFLLIP